MSFGLWIQYYNQRLVTDVKDMIADTYVYPVVDSRINVSLLMIMSLGIKKIVLTIEKRLFQVIVPTVTFKREVEERERQLKTHINHDYENNGGNNHDYESIDNVKRETG
ncbi:unnamed protein product [Oppiella nova]|uniref:Uncharacterized protein n=1 Tax=Oppiella nova TaxID=334625 RepID=A0A7R9QPD9_9ACAR|nr:unnamed protein product [Oppiella nova]CAG2168953.1 unnamed protein product [Oppiella nova]